MRKGGAYLVSNVQAQDSPAAVGTGSASIAAADSVRWVAGSGNDANDGLSAAAPKLTLQAAYAALPSSGGTLLISPGRYDVLGGLVISRGKPVWMNGLVEPPPYIVSTTTAPLASNCAILYSSTGAASLITTTGGTAANLLNGLRFENLLFEFSQSTTLVGIDADTTNYGKVIGCYFFADKTSGAPGPAAVTAIGVKVRASAPGTYGGDDASWWRLNNNKCMNMALCELGNSSGTKYSANQHVVTQNIGLGLTHTNTSTKPFIALYGGHRCVIGDNNIEAYNIGIRTDTCWDCQERGDGGEFVDVFVDSYGDKGLSFAPIGIAYAALGNNAATTPILAGALIFRSDAFTKACLIIVQDAWNAANTQRLANPTDDPSHPYISLGSTDNIVVSPRNSMNQGNRDLVGTGSPNSAVIGNVGDTYRRTDGGASTTFYIKESGAATNTGWVAYGAPSTSNVSVVSRTTDSTINSAGTGATLTSDDTLLFAIGASATEMWFFDAFILVNAANITMDMKIGLALPASATASWGNGDVAGATANPGFPSVTAATTPTAPLAAAGVVTLGTPAANLLMVHVSGWVTGGGTAGNVVLKFAQNTADAGNLVIKTGSHLKYYKLVS